MMFDAEAAVLSDIHEEIGQLPQICLSTFALAGIAACSIPGTSGRDDGPEIKFLLSHLDAVDPERKGWSANLSNYLKHPVSGDLSLFHLSSVLGLQVFEILTAALAASVEENVMAGRVVAYVQAPLGGSRPTLGLLANAFRNTLGDAGFLCDKMMTGAGIKTGLIKVMGESVPLPERPVSVPLHLCLAFRGSDADLPGTEIGTGIETHVPLPDSIINESLRLASGLSAASGRMLIIRSGSIAEGKSVAHQIALALERRPLFIESEAIDGLGPWLVLRNLLPVFCLELSPGEKKHLPAITGYRGPVLCLCGPDGSVDSAGNSSLSWTIPVPEINERRYLWEISTKNSELSESLSRKHRYRASRIADLGKLAQYRSHILGKVVPDMDDIRDVSMSGEGCGLESLAQHLSEIIPDEALVKTSGLEKDLETLLMRCKYRDGLANGLGVSSAARYRPGVRVLLVGPSGTGKTLGAGWLATKLGLPLFRVDLASVTSKYIGETEKNLSQLLARAEQTEVVLLFDEADSLFGKRTDVHQANDRFANAQTNYLLQRIETYDGITILTSNSQSRFDPAFSRRLDMIIEFPIPGPTERKALWLSHLGENHSLSKGELNKLAATVDFAGGHIRNVVLSAAVLARNFDKDIEYEDITEGLLREYKKQGRQMPVELKIKKSK